MTDTGRGHRAGLFADDLRCVSAGAVRGSTGAGGFGLGLAISKAIAELHGGELTAFSRGRGTGATFSLILPCCEGGRTATSAQPGAIATVSELRILVVEDHETTAALMARLLGRRGHIVKIAHSVREALAAAGEQPFDIVLSDIGLPDGSGFELMKQLRDRHGLRGIALTGYGMDLDQQLSAEAGFLAHLTKPVDVARLLQTLAGLGSPAVPG